MSSQSKARWLKDLSENALSPAIVGLLAVIQLAGQERAVVKFSIGEE